MNEMKIKLIENGKMPVRMTPGSCAFDCWARAYEPIPEFRQIRYWLGFAVEVPEGFAALLMPRSSICKTSMRMANGVGLIDRDFRGEVSAVFDVIGDGNLLYGVGERVAQMLIVPAPLIQLEQVDELSTTSRGDGGYGSTERR